MNPTNHQFADPQTINAPRVRACRNRYAKIGQNELAKRIGISNSEFSKLLDYSNKNVGKCVKPATLEKLVDFFDEPADFFVMEKNEPSISQIEIETQLIARAANEYVFLHRLSMTTSRKLRWKIAHTIENLLSEEERLIDLLAKNLRKRTLEWPLASDLITEIWDKDDECHQSILSTSDQLELCAKHFEVGDYCQWHWLMHEQQRLHDLSSPNQAQSLLSWVSDFFIPSLDYPRKLSSTLTKEPFEVIELKAPLEHHVSLLAKLVKAQVDIRIPS